MMCIASLSLCAAEPDAGAPSNRYLLIVETSETMQRRAENAVTVINDLLAGGLRGEMRRGDTIGVWTYNDVLTTGVVPLQRWSPENRLNVARTVSVAMKAQKFEKASDFSAVTPALAKVLADSPHLTVIVVADGLGGIHGTPFDQRINDIFRTWKSEQQKARMPFTTILRAQNGNVTGFAVTPAPWPLELPALPAELSGRGAAAKKDTNATLTLPPLIISGKKAAPLEPIKVKTNAPLASTQTNLDVSRPSPGSVAPALPTNAVETVAPAPAPVIEATNTAAGAPQTSSVPDFPTVPSSAQSRAAAEVTETSAVTQLPAAPVHQLSPAPSANLPTQAPESGIKTGPAEAALQKPPPVSAVSAANPTRKPGSRLWLWAAGGMAVLCLAVVMLMLRRPKKHVSLITQSYDKRP